LLGIPLAHKDIFVTRDWASTASSRILLNQNGQGYLSPFDATVVDNLKRAGMVCLGKLNCDEFAMGSSNENSAFGNVLNPWDTNAVPGGSSAVLPGCGRAHRASGDRHRHGGSIRGRRLLPGSPVPSTYGRPSRWGMIAFASSLEPRADDVFAEDCALVFNAMLASIRRTRPASIVRAKTCPPPWSQSQRAEDRRPQGVLRPRPAADVEAAVRAALAEYEKLGATMVPISLPNAELAFRSTT